MSGPKGTHIRVIEKNRDILQSLVRLWGLNSVDEVIGFILWNVDLVELTAQRNRAMLLELIEENDE